MVKKVENILLTKKRRNSEIISFGGIRKMNVDFLKRALQIQHSKVINISKNEKNYAFTFIYPPSKLLYSIDENVIGKKEITEANLYVHIPYCTGRCTYCYFGCYSIASAPFLERHYVETICREMELINDKYGKIKILSIHFGGGTPTTLTEEQINFVFSKIRDCFDVEPEIEITFESSPETLTESKLRCMVKNGVNRLNIGIQTLNDDLLKSINRRHNSRKALEGIKLAKSMGIHNINVDVMYGLKGQTMEDWLYTLNTVLDMGIQSISAYRLRIHPMGKLKEDINYFDEDNAIQMYIAMLGVMDKYGFYQCSSHKFAIKEEMVQKQIVNKRGIEKSTLIPVGMAAYGSIDNIVYWNERTMEKYVEKINKNVLPISIGYVLDKTEEISKVCVLGIHNVNGINLVKFKEKFGFDIKFVYGELVDRLVKCGLLEVSDINLKPSKLGMVFADEIATEFYSDNVKKQLEIFDDKYGIFFDSILD